MDHRQQVSDLRQMLQRLENEKELQPGGLCYVLRVLLVLPSHSFEQCSPLGKQHIEAVQMLNVWKMIATGKTTHWSSDRDEHGGARAISSDLGTRNDEDDDDVYIELVFFGPWRPHHVAICGVIAQSPVGWPPTGHGLSRKFIFCYIHSPRNAIYLNITLP